jgi:hypothetical protein
MDNNGYIYSDRVLKPDDGVSVVAFYSQTDIPDTLTIDAPIGPVPDRRLRSIHWSPRRYPKQLAPKSVSFEPVKGRLLPRSEGYCVIQANKRVLTFYSRRPHLNSKSISRTDSRSSA